MLPAFGSARFVVITGGGKWMEILANAGPLYQHLIVEAKRSRRIAWVPVNQPLRASGTIVILSARQLARRERCQIAISANSTHKGAFMLQIKVVLIDTTGQIEADTMAAAAEALNVQVTRDLPQFWSINATVSYRPDATSVPQGMWPVLIVDALPPGEGGFHMTQHNQPYAKVVNTPDSDEWTIDASHETIEMLVDPYGNRLQASAAIGISGRKIEDVRGKFEYLVEACDPCEANKHAYSIDGIMVSDFITPDFYDLSPTPNTRYSFTGAIKSPREILPGG